MEIAVMNSLSRSSSVMNDYHMNSLSRTASMNYASDDDIMDGLSRIIQMGDDEMDETLNKFRIRFGKGKGKAKRKEKKRIKMLAKAEKKRRKAEKKANLRKGRKAQTLKATSFITGLAAQVFGDKGGGEGAPEELVRRMLLDEPEPEIPWLERETWGIKNQNLLIGSSIGAVVIGGGIVIYRRRKKKKR